MTECYRMKDGFNNKDDWAELTVETSCEMSDSYNIFSDDLSPIPASIVPRKLDFTLDDDDGIRDATPPPASHSPPYKRVRDLRLFDTPHTPKSLLEKCSTPTHHPPRSRLFPPKLTNQSGMPSGSSHHLHPPAFDDDSALGSLPPDELEESRLCSKKPLVNINPFTPDGQALNRKKRALSKTPTWGSTPELPAKRIRESNISRYNVEFVELGVIGCGEFGLVTKCLNKLDGCVYALKRSLRPVGSTVIERAAYTEVYAHSAVGKHPNIVNYYSAWTEDGHMIIQSEYCDGGSLQQRLADGPLCESEMMVLLQHVASGLAFIHAMKLVHMDLKPENIFVCNDVVQPPPPPPPEPDDGYDEDEQPSRQQRHVYKIGDLGHVTMASAPQVEEGDCRYLPKEVLQENLKHLQKADIFALGLTLFEVAGGGPLPKNGDLKSKRAKGQKGKRAKGQKGKRAKGQKGKMLPDLPNLSRGFNALLKKMVDPDPTVRPSADDLIRHPYLYPENKSKSELLRELAAAEMKNELLAKKLEEAARCIKSLTPSLVQNQESAKFRTRSAKRLQKPRHENLLSDVIVNVTSPSPLRKRRLDRRTKKV
ncbi:hypothetical protein K1T71_000980 [Dendrolimus kikuchii]|uniref:Uncharacterized protein n=1 Tax=Dendrolimus kikuchii TaxID=765133 RepID=A0ACC1DG93_9NEOP|nr:hypothetical protein K1T71_000980 [Dendrolimus kikuchii]